MLNILSLIKHKMTYVNILYIQNLETGLFDLKCTFFIGKYIFMLSNYMASVTFNKLVNDNTKKGIAS